MKISGSRKEKTVVFDFNGKRIRSCLFRGFFPFSSFLVLRQSAIIFLLKRMATRLVTHCYSINFTILTCTELAAEGNRHSLSNRRNICDVHVHRTHISIIYAHLYEANNSKQQQLGILYRKMRRKCKTIELRSIGDRLGWRLNSVRRFELSSEAAVDVNMHLLGSRGCANVWVFLVDICREIRDDDHVQSVERSKV